MVDMGALAVQVLILTCVAASTSANTKTCEENEVYLECGICEASCDSPIPQNCTQECKPGRCYCHYGDRLVRHDGKCIPLAECPTDEPDPCADMVCPDNEKCILDALLCEKPPCPRMARCPIPQEDPKDAV
ncbi:hypothetical protein QR680_006226 [Steinernema hermaphroditum]|uniref:TIL domain-containing protein n=1 Tax=Steinernema hermaphroditum TaxID=289476 RepID=A0AA39LW71_9BILA|nr:hypothetical protein QR680_006226 [Steinernema hermaphroditum]